MRKPTVLIAIVALSFLTNCSKTKDAFDSLECAKLLQKINTDDNETCAQIISDINKIEKSCGAFLDADDKELLAFAKANCQDDN